MKNKPRLKKEYDKKIREEIMKEQELDNIMEVPNLEKIVINTGLGEATSDSKVIEEFTQELALITGQKPVATVARGAVSGFKVRKGQEIGLKVTLRGVRMWEFLDKLINVVFPRTKDFRGVPAKSFDGAGNYTVGMEEHTAFPEVDPNKVTKMRGLEITLVTTTRDDKLAKAFLDKFGFPFREDA